MSEQLLLSQSELARLLNLSSRTISRMNASRKIPKPVRVGRSVRWRRAEIKRWVAAGCPNRSEWEAATANLWCRLDDTESLVASSGRHQ